MRPVPLFISFFTGVVMLMILLSFKQLAVLDLPAPLGFACGASISAFACLWGFGLYVKHVKKQQ